MATRSITVGDAADTTVSKVTDKVTETATQVKDKVDANRNVAAQGLEQAASTIRDKADSLPGGETVTDLAHTAADKLTATAGYVRDTDVNTMMADVETLVKKNPGPALMAAAVVGFLVGRAFSGND
jgi:ElaB/YqjD/DUF883 family membrane-anchored ribosome-binding protein